VPPLPTLELMATGGRSLDPSAEPELTLHDLDAIGFTH
jgi:hypothetical protein